MQNNLFRTNKEIAEIYEKHVDTVYRVCFTYLKNIPDTEDAVQTTFVKLIKYKGEFESTEHEKSWLIVTATNSCKDLLKNWWNKRENIEKYENSLSQTPFEIDDTLSCVLRLPDKYKVIVYLYYYEGYSTVEIAKMFKKADSTIRNQLRKARNMLYEKLEIKDD